MGERDERELESALAAELKAWSAQPPIGTDLPTTPPHDLCASLERFLPLALQRRHPVWVGESFDGFSFAVARKTGRFAVRLGGTAILIRDQTVTPFVTDLTCASSRDSIVSFRVCVGERAGGALGISGPRWGTHAADELLLTIASRLDRIVWVYAVRRDGDG